MTKSLLRRSTAVAALGTTAAVVLTACGGGTADEPAALDPDADLTQQTIVVSNWESYMPEDIAELVKDETGATVKVTHHATNEDLVAKVTAGGGDGLDVIFGTAPFLEAFAKEGLLEPIDTSLLENWGELDALATDGAVIDGETYWAPYTWGTTGICYREDLVDEAPNSWYDLLTPADEYKGKVTMMGTDRWAVLPAQKALGFSANTTDEAEMAEVKDLMLQAKPNLLAYDDNTFYERLISGEAVMVEAWDGWCNYGTAENDNIKFVVPEEGSDLFVDGMAILKSSKSKEAAYAFIDTVLKPENHAWAAENILYNVPNQAALDLLPDELLKTYDVLGERRPEMLEGEALTDVGDAASLYTKIITEVTAS
ncbi:spermidine/putrescine ABC transporter substrate-binding protein [Georgenia yuyongxinii]|uniref:polyamine ABC transporter substrate-binding protein n=1 Tax=Georgenia yuyongxinii TaxID=2589797 RepID=UPI001CB6E04D|nr:spermidine/putrescine ABC transporter substrate-binding protein [Georgenia yuyongxinii]